MINITTKCIGAMKTCAVAILFLCLQVTSIHAESVLLNTKFDVYKSPSCGCCEKWVEHIKEESDQVEVHHPKNLHALKKELGIQPEYQSCHTATHDNYVFEGHIPLKYIEQFLAEKPVDAIGLSVPGMPLGSPGMEVGSRFMPYKVLLLRADGSVETYADIKKSSDQY